MKRVFLFLMAVMVACGIACAQEIDFNQILSQAKKGDKVAQYNMGVY